MNKPGYFTPVRIGFWVIMISILLFVASVWLTPYQHHQTNDRAHCIMNQRNLQQALRGHQGMNHLKLGDPIDWSELIGPDLFLEQQPECPVHGVSGDTSKCTTQGRVKVYHPWAG